MKGLFNLKKVKWQLIVMFAGGIIQFLLMMCLPLIIVMIILSPIVSGIDGSRKDKSDQTTENESGNFWEQLGNFLTFRGFNTDETIFHQKIKDANNQYGSRIDIPLILATIYYPFNVAYEQKVNQCLNQSTENKSECDKYDIDYDNNDDEDEGDETDKDDKAARVAINGRFDALINNILSANSMEPDYEKYDEYLRTKYIAESPEFGYPWAIENQDQLDDKIKVIIQSIHATAKEYQDLFGEIADVSFGDSRFQIIMSNNLLQLPIKGEYRISSCFGPREINNKPGTHKGTDIVIDGSDKNIYSASDGIIVAYKNDLTTNCSQDGDISAPHACGADEARGNYVKVKSKLDLSDDYHYTIFYEHLSSVDSVIVNAMKASAATGGEVTIKKGDVIGVVGTTGHSDGIHLHFEIDYDGTAINPGYYLFTNPKEVGDNCPAHTPGTDPGGGGYQPPQGPAATRIIEVGRAMADPSYEKRHDVYNYKNIDYMSPGAAAAKNPDWRGETFSGHQHGGMFHTDCNGFVGLVMRAALPEIGMPAESHSVGEFTTFGPSGGSWGPRSKYDAYFKVLRSHLNLNQMRQAINSGEILAGDAIGFNPTKQYCDKNENDVRDPGEKSRDVSTHVAIYAGDKKIIENSGGVKYRSFEASPHVECNDSKYTIIRYTGK